MRHPLLRFRRSETPSESSMPRTLNTAAIEKATGKSWEKWLNFFDKIGAEKLPHKEIAQKIHTEGHAGPWWAQMVTVAYEQHIARRRPGQSCTGKYQISVSKTVPGTLDDALRNWLKLMAGRKEFAGVAIERAPTTSGSGKFRYWHCGLSDGTRLNVGIYEKERGKSVIALGHEKVESEKQSDRWRDYWKSQMAMVSAPTPQAARRRKKTPAVAKRPARSARSPRRR